MSGNPVSMVDIQFLRKFNPMDPFFIEGNLIDCLKRIIQPVKMKIDAGKIVAIQPTESLNINPSLPYILPGFV
ncbi:MAG: hypothetical protein ACO28V_08330, partial [Chitinophagaceae bacterium]